MLIDLLEIDNFTTTQRDAITNPPKGCIIFNSTNNLPEVNYGTSGTPDWGSIGRQSYAEMYMEGNSTNTVLVWTEPIKIAGTTTSDEKSADFTHSSNKLIYIGIPTKKFKISVVTSTTRAGGAGDKNGVFHIAKNGAVVEKTKSGNKSINNLITETTFQGIIELATDDYIENFVTNLTDAQTFLIEHMNCIIEEINT